MNLFNQILDVMLSKENYLLMIESSTAPVNACPICRYPVTFGGGKTIVKGFLDPLITFSGLLLKKSFYSHHYCQYYSTIE
jgi:hypothetical protein